MHKFVFLVISILITNIAVASDVMWYWDEDGATKGLIPDPNCQCYFSLEFPVKVMPKSGTYFTLYEVNSQIVTLKLSQFMNPLRKDEDPGSILSRHLEYELGYLKGVVGNDSLLIERRMWNKNNRIMSWVIRRQSGKALSYLVSSSVVKSDCVFYLTSLVSNKSLIPKIEEAQQKSLTTLKSHVPTSEEDAKKLINDFTKS